MSLWVGEHLALSESQWKLGRILCVIIVTITVTICFTNASRAQQRVDFGPSPYGEPPFPEFLVSPGALGGLFAVSRPDGIFYDMGKVELHGGLNTPLFLFMRAHEYGHVRRGHIHTPVPVHPQVYYTFELEADCDAAGLFGWRSNEIQFAVRAYQQELPPYDTPGMPGSERRAQNLFRCGNR